MCHHNFLCKSNLLLKKTTVNDSLKMLPWQLHNGDNVIQRAS